MPTMPQSAKSASAQHSWLHPIEGLKTPPGTVSTDSSCDIELG